MSKSDSLLLLETILKEVERRGQKVSGKKTKARDELDQAVSAYSVHPDIIYEDIKKKDSPFLVDYNYTDAELRVVAKKISNTMYSAYRRQIKRIPLSGIFKITNFNLPDEFINPSGRSGTAGYDNGLRTIFYQSPKKGGNVYEAFAAALKRPVEDKLKALPPTHPAHIYVSPSKEWANRINLAGLAAAASYEKAYKAGKIPEKSYNNKELKKRNIESRKGRILKEDRESGDFNTYEGIQVGHTFGAGATEIAPLAKSEHDLAHQDIETIELVSFGKEFSDRAGPIKKNFKKVIKRDTTMEFEKIFNSTDAKVHITLTVPESKFANQSTGGSIGTALTELRTAVKKLNEDIAHFKGSPSYIQELIDRIERIFLGKKPKNIRTKNRVKKTSKTNVTVRVFGARGAKPTIRRSKGRGKGTEQGDPNRLNEILVILNARLHDQIRKNMGKGRSKQKLNYRTGRFAKSALVENLYPSREKSALNAKVKYHGYPYSTFEKGGKLYKPLRDPKGIFGRSIRQILQEEKIATLRRVKVELING